MQCPNCEADNRDDAKFCDECGFPLSGSIARAAGAASPRMASDDSSFSGIDDGSWGQGYVMADDKSRLPIDFPPSESEPIIPEPGPSTSAQASLADIEPTWADVQDDRNADPFGESANDEPVEEVFATLELPIEPAAELHASKPELPDDGPADDGDASDAVSYGEFAWPKDRSFTPADDLDYFGSYDDLFALDDEPTDTSSDGKDGWKSDLTMQISPVPDRKDGQAREFRNTSAKARKRGGRQKAVIVAAIVVTIAVIAGILSFAFGFWGGKALPNVVGMTEADARATLVDEGFTVRSLQVKSDETEGLVLLMDPVAGSRVEEGSEIVIQVATARYIPNVVGKGYEEAAAALAEAGYENVRVEKQKSNDEENVVVSISPDAGTRAKSTMEIVITVTEAYRVPDISDMDIESARSAIKEAGLTPQAIYVDTEEYVDGTIIGTDPEAGTKVSEGDYVTINIARARGVELKALTQELLAPGNTVKIGGYEYDIESLDSVEYQGNDTVSFTASGRPKVTLFGETLYASSSQSISGQVVWSSSNEVVSIG